VANEIASAYTEHVRRVGEYLRYDFFLCGPKYITQLFVIFAIKVERCQLVAMVTNRENKTGYNSAWRGRYVGSGWVIVCVGRVGSGPKNIDPRPTLVYTADLVTRIHKFGLSPHLYAGRLFAS